MYKLWGPTGKRGDITEEILTPSFSELRINDVIIVRQKSLMLQI